MKFAHKLFFSVIALLTVIFLLFGTFMLSSYFDRMLERETEQDFPDSGCAEGCQKGMVPNPVYYWRCCSISIVFRNAVAGNV